MCWVGDGTNDLHLFSVVGRRVAMGNADPLLVEYADEVTDSVERDGLASVIEKYVPSRPKADHPP